MITNGFFELKEDMLQMIDLSAEMARLNQMIIHHSDMNDKRNYNPEKCEKAKEKVNELLIVYFHLKQKWFGVM